MDSGTSSQFIDVDYTGCMNLEMTLKPESQDLILAAGKPFPIGKITHTCTIKYRRSLLLVFCCGPLLVFCRTHMLT